MWKRWMFGFACGLGVAGLAIVVTLVVLKKPVLPRIATKDPEETAIKVSVTQYFQALIDGDQAKLRNVVTETPEDYYVRRWNCKIVNGRRVPNPEPTPPVVASQPGTGGAPGGPSGSVHTDALIVPPVNMFGESVLKGPRGFGRMGSDLLELREVKYLGNEAQITAVYGRGQESRSSTTLLLSKEGAQWKVFMVDAELTRIEPGFAVQTCGGTVPDLK
jgi:hypothetical protein